MYSVASVGLSPCSAAWITGWTCGPPGSYESHYHPYWTSQWGEAGWSVVPCDPYVSQWRLSGDLCMPAGISSDFLDARRVQFAFPHWLVIALCSKMSSSAFCDFHKGLIWYVDTIKCTEQDVKICDQSIKSMRTAQLWSLSVIFISFAISCLGLQEEEQSQTAHPASFTWSSHIAARVHCGMSNLYSHPQKWLPTEIIFCSQ